ncbi:MAG TPA: SRPBCC family protein [Candidatus Rubrimentiphilum sp.]|nr:SRPBCC family protein [Candidatus Rubrimentiphilum sp.]
MHLRNEILIKAAPAVVFGYAHDTARWPEYLPHYRYVRVLESNGNRRLVEMGALRGRIPVSWRAEQVNDSLTPSIRFKHVRGWTRGMDVVWHFEPVPGGTRVSIDHEANLVFPIGWIAGRFFIDHVATQTLRRMKALSENHG